MTARFKIPDCHQTFALKLAFEKLRRRDRSDADPVSPEPVEVVGATETSDLIGFARTPHLVGCRNTIFSDGQG